MNTKSKSWWRFGPVFVNQNQHKKQLSNLITKRLYEYGTAETQRSIQWFFFIFCLFLFINYMKFMFPNIKEFSCQSDATFQLNPEVCQRNRLDNPELNTIPDDSYNRPFKWRREPWQPSMSQRLQQFQEVPSYHSDNEMHPSNIVEAATFNSPSLLLANREPDRYAPRSGQWGPWKSISSCRSGCLLSSKGLRLVERTCYSGQCQGSSSSVQLCTPSFQVLQSILQFKFALTISFLLH